MWNPKLVLLFSIFCLPGFGWSLKLTGTVVPYYGVLGREGILECNFDLEDDSLYILKWYKDGHEFFRFKPQPHKLEPPITVFPLLGVSVNANRSSLHRVHLDSIAFESRGSYRCEISADAPSFRTLYEENTMEVMVLPQKGPKLTGIHPWYNIGDNFTAMCSVSNSYPEAKLSWFVNDMEINSASCECITLESTKSKIIQDEQILYNTSAQLRFPVESNYFRDGTLMVECRATFAKSPIILQDIVTTNVKSGLGRQYADLVSSAHVLQPILFVFQLVAVSQVILEAKHLNFV